MRHRVRQVHEERLFLVLLHKVNRLLRVPPRHGTLVDRQFHDLFVLEQRSLPFRQRRLGILPQRVHALPTALGLALVIRVIHIVGVRNAEISIKAVGGREHFWIVPQVPLAEASRRVALALQVIRNRMLVWMKPLGRCRKQHVLMHPNAFRITPRHQCRSRRRAHRRGNHEARELASLFSQPIDVWCLDRLRAKAAQITVALIVRKDDHKVWLPGGSAMGVQHTE